MKVKRPGTWSTVGQTLNLIIERLAGTRRPLFFDEAHRLPRHTFSRIRTIHDRAEVPIVIVGTDEIISRIDDRAGHRGQMASRCLMYNAMDYVFDADDPDGKTRGRPLFSAEEIKAVFAKMRIKVDRDAFRLMWGLACLTGDGSMRLVGDLIGTILTDLTLSSSLAPDGGLLLAFEAQDGAGASTAALHTAGYLANELKARTLLAEIDYFSDSVAYRLRLAETRSLSDLAPGQDWRAAITEWNGLHLLAAPTSTRALRTRGLPEVARAIGESCQEYEFVVGDLPCNTTVVSRDLLSWTDRLYVVATAELTSLYLARRRVHSLVTTGAKMESIRLIVNRDRPGAVETDLAEQVTGLKPSHRLPNDFAAASAAETDAALAPRNSALGRAYAALAADVYGKPAKAAPSNARGWGRLLAALR